VNEEMNVEYLGKSPDGHSEDTSRSATIPLESPTTDPFANTRDSRFYFGSATHETALLQLRALLDDGNQGWGSLRSETGLGKTLLRTLLHKSLDPQRFVGISIETSLLNFDELMLEIISQISGERVYSAEFPDRYSRLSEFKLLLTERVVHAGRHLVILLDEAHGLDGDTLDGLRNLSNIGAEQCNLMSFILIGNSKFESRLRRMPELGPRIAVWSSLTALDAQQTRAYVQHRLNVAGCEQTAMFAQSSWDRLQQVSGGVPREINRILKHTMGLAQISGEGLSDTALSEALTTLSSPDSVQNPEFHSLGMS